MHYSRWLGLLVLLSIAIGCSGEPSAEVKGTITINGKAPQMSGLRIRFMSADGQPKLFDVAADGSFVAPSVSPGENRLSLYYEPAGAPTAEERAEIAQNISKDKGKNAKSPHPKGAVADKNPIPQKYRDSFSSGKMVQIEAGKSNALTWDIPNK